MSLLDFDNFDSKTASGGNGGQIIFISGKNTQPTPLTFRPLPGVLPVVSVYDAALKRSRKPLAGEKAQTKFMFSAVMPDGEVKVISAGATVIDGIKAVRQMRVSLDQSADGYVEVSSKGSGMDTKYSVINTSDKKLKTKKIDTSALVLPDLEAIAASLVVDTTAEVSTPTGGTPVNKNDPALASF